MDGWKQDLVHGVRVFKKTPGWTAVILLSMALGMGANTAIFTVVKAILLHPLPFHNSEQLVIVWEDASFVNFPKNTPAPANYFDWKQQSHSFSGMAAVSEKSFNLTGFGEALRLPAYGVTGDFFQVLGMKAQRGRTIQPSDDSTEAQRVAVISHGLWQRSFGSNPELIGKDLLLNHAPYTIIGVMPPNFQFLDPEIDVWVPIAFTPEERNNRDGHYLQVVGRLKDGVPLQQAQAEIATIMKRIADAYPDSAGRIGSLVLPLRDEIVGEIRSQLLVLFGAVGLVLLIACANIANLLLSASITRKKEMAVRAALGAARRRILRQLMIESLVLALAGGILGLAISVVSFSFLKNLVPQGGMLFTRLTLDPVVLIFTVFSSILAGLLFGLAPALRASETDLSESLKTGGARAGNSDGRKFRGAMVIAETALALVLLVGAGLLIQTMDKLQKINLGFDANHVVRLQTDPPRFKYDSLQKRVQFHEAVLARVESLPGVISAGYSTAVPLDWKGGTNGYAWEGKPTNRNEALDANHREVSARFLQTLRMSLAAGTFFTGQETSTSEPVVIVNEAMARTYSPDFQNALGQRFRVSSDTPWFRVIGIVKNIRNMGLQEEQKAEMYFPMQQADFGYSFFAPRELLIRTSTAAPLKLAPDVRQIVKAIDPDVPVSDVMTLEFVVARELQHRRTTMILLAAFAALALLLAAVGIYGVLSYFVNQQVPEIGIRLAIGAQPASILMLVLRRGMGLCLTGVALGVAGSLALTGVLRSSLYGIGARDPKTIVVVAGVIVLTALAACLIPGRRAMKVSPLKALRYE